MANRKAVLNSIPKFLRPRKKFKPNLRDPIKSWNIVKGDKVAVIDGPHKGQQGEVLAVLRQQKRIIVDGVNMRFAHLKSKYWETKAPTIMKPASLHYSNVNLVDPTNGLPTRVGTGYLDDGTRVRVSKRTGAIIPKPVFTRPRPKNLGMCTVAYSCKYYFFNRLAAYFKFYLI